MTVNVNIEDDVPTVKASEDVIVLTVEESSSAVSNSIDVSSQFAHHAGADGERSHSYEVTLSENAQNNITAIVNGGESDITLGIKDGVLTGATADGTVIFTVSVDDKGLVTLTMTGAGTLKHKDGSLLLDGVGVKLTVTDNDGDTASDEISLELSIDDGPMGFNDYTSQFETRTGSAADSITLDFNDKDNTNQYPQANTKWVPDGYHTYIEQGGTERA